MRIIDGGTAHQITEVVRQRRQRNVASVYDADRHPGECPFQWQRFDGIGDQREVQPLLRRIVSMSELMIASSVTMAERA